MTTDKALRPVEYRISFMTPDGNGKDECVDFDATTPFQAVHVGDEVLGMTWHGYTRHKYGDTLAAVARVTRVVRVVQAFPDKIFDSTVVYTAFAHGFGPG